MSTYDDLLKQYKKKAKLADQYMRRLEKLSASDKAYKGVKNYAYARARHDIETWSGKGARRFDTKAPEKLQSLRAKLRDIERFLQSPTSTKRGIDQIYNKRAQTMKERYGVSGNWEDMVKYYNRGLNEKMDKAYGSRTALRAVGRIQQNSKAIRKAMRSGSIDTYISESMSGEDKPVRDAIKGMLETYSKDLRKAGIL